MATTNPVMRAWFRTRERGPGAPMQTMKIPNWIVRPSTSIRLFQRIISGRKFTASHVWRGHSCPQAAKLVPDTRKPELSSQLHATQYPLLAKSWKPEARSYEVYNSISND